MPSPKLPGATWWKIDFHAHSPRSFDFGGLEGEASATVVSVDDWLLAYMRAGVDAIVVTDHNAHDGIDEARAALVRLEETGNPDFRELVLFPGVELTIDGNYHLLAVFDVSEASEKINGLLHRLDYQGARGSSNGTANRTFQEAIAEILSDGGLPIPAHADGPRGLFQHASSNVDAIVAEGNIVAAEIVTADGAKRALKYGWVAVLGSDAHHLDASGAPDPLEAKFPGSHFTWVKMSEPNLNGLKVAISDGETSVIPSRVSVTDPNVFDHNVIEKIVITMDGVTSEQSFSPWMTAIIGGRGVGKSTIVELIRLGLDRFTDLPDDLQSDLEWYSPRPGAERVWNNDTKIDIHYRRSDREYRILWRGSSPSEFSIEANSATGWEPQEGEVRERFPILMNSQKQIYETAKDPQSLLTIIDAQPEIDLPGWLEEFRRLGSQYRTERAEVAELELQTASKGRVLGEVADVQAELDRRGRIETSQEAEELEQLTALESDFALREKAAEALQAGLTSAISQFEATVPDTESSSDWGPELARIRGSLEGLTLSKQAEDSLKNSYDDWTVAEPASPRRARIGELRVALGSTDDDGSITDSVSDLIERKASLALQLRSIEQAEADLTVAQGKASATLQAVGKSRGELTERRRAFVAGLGDRQLVVEVFAQADSGGLDAELRRLVQRPTSFDSVFESGGLRKVLVANPRDPKYLAEVETLKSLLKEIRIEGRDSLLYKSNSLQVDARFLQHLETLDEGQFATEVDLWFPDDSLNIRYQQDPEKQDLINLDQGSPGQKTAALLALMMQIGREPLILDQPEDDLDNKLIYDLVVTRLKALKTSRQLIVVSHNANVVVNADAELVVVMQHGMPPRAESEGCIQDDRIRADVCLIMEGGELAFRNRYGRLILT